MQFNSVSAGLSRAAELLADAAKQNASWSSTIPSAISVSPVRRSGDTLIVDVTVDLKRAPSAAAFEYGSGIHATKGEKRKYVIQPRGNKRYLAFFWEAVDEYTPLGHKFKGISKKTGKALFTFVEHPGVAQRAFLRPAFDSNRDKIRDLVGGGFRLEIIGQIREAINVSK